MGLKAPDIQKIIGRVAQIVNDNSSVLPSQLQSWITTQEPPIVLSQAKISLEEKVRVWQAINKPYQISLFYKAAPVFLSANTSVKMAWIDWHPFYHVYMGLKNACFGVPVTNPVYYLCSVCGIVILFQIVQTDHSLIRRNGTPTPEKGQFRR